MFIGRDREKLKDTVWATPSFYGVQVAYSWRLLEPQKDQYDFSAIREDIELLKKHGKRLFIQLQDVSFSVKINNTPKYIMEDKRYHGGANKQYNFKDDKETKYTVAGWVTRRWDPAVQERLHKLYAALGKEFDGQIEGINTAETAVDFGKGPLHPPGFNFRRYKEATIQNAGALKSAFPRTIVMIYANFMPGGFLPYMDSVYMKEVYQYAWDHNIGVGGPDLFPYKRGQMANSYGFIKESAGKVATGLAFQDGNADYINPNTNKKITIEEIYAFAKDYLHLRYIFWGTEDPFFHDQVVLFLRILSRK